MLIPELPELRYVNATVDSYNNYTTLLEHLTKLEFQELFNVVSDAQDKHKEHFKFTLWFNDYTFTASVSKALANHKDGVVLNVQIDTDQLNQLCLMPTKETFKHYILSLC